MDELRAQANEIIRCVQQVILGKDEVVKKVMAAFLANGHILLEDIPGVGKTTMALAFSKVLGLKWNRVQFTPDVMPSDLTGFSVYRRDTEQFVYQPGSVFCNLLLADEINRTSPKTQSALLEVMEERQVSVEGVTRPVPLPFLVIATQNPYGTAGTQPLPAVQTDRFMISLSLGYPDFESELKMARSLGPGRRTDGLVPIADEALLITMQAAVRDIYMRSEVYEFIIRLVDATRRHPAVALGASPRATLALVQTSRAVAWLSGNDYASPRNVLDMFSNVVSHRIVLSETAQLEGMSKEDVIADIIKRTSQPAPGSMSR